MFATEVLGHASHMGRPSVRADVMRRSQSQPFDLHHGGESVPGPSVRAMERQMRKLQREVAMMNERLAIFEDVQARWGVRYTRRMAVVANAFMGTWVLAFRLLRFLQKRRAMLLQAMMPKLQLRAQAGVKAQQQLKAMLWGGVRHSLRHSWVFFVAAVLLTRNRAWNRFAGALLGTFYAGYIAAAADTGTRWPWVTLAIAGNLAYLGTSMHVSGALLPTIEEDASRQGDAYDDELDEGL